MNVVDVASQNQLKNIQARTGKTLEELYALIRTSGLAKHGEIRDYLKRELAMGHGDANALAGAFLKSEGQAAAPAAEPTADDVLGGLYSGAKAGLRPIHDRLMAAIAGFGPFEIAPKKGYLSLRRKKQFAMIGPATKGRVEVGLNMKGIPPTARLIELPAGGMCQYKVDVADVSEVDQELKAWIKQAYDSAG
jgi:hypothetical protein